MLPLAVAGATNVTTQLGAASSPGIRLKTAELAGLREVPITSLPNRSDELLAFVSEQPDWKLTLAAEKLAPRVVAEVFNLVTVGNGVVGGSATIRYGIFNQGVQEFRIALPAHWKNVEFTGANIRRKEQQTNVWTITLQDKAWGGYTLVVTYDYQFDPKGSTLDLAGAHALGVERETGSLGLMTAASLKLTPAAPADPLRRVDEAELSESDRALCTRPLLLAYKYTGGDYQHTAQVTRFEEVPVLDAVADRIELTTVLTEEGQLLTQSSFMVKNNEKQFQKFKLPQGAEFWSSYVNGQPAKPERDGEWLLVPLPRDANRDQAFAVDIVYAQKINLKTSLFPRRGRTGRAAHRHSEHLRRVAALCARLAAPEQLRRQHDRGARHDLRPARRVAGVHPVLRQPHRAQLRRDPVRHRRRAGAGADRGGGAARLPGPGYGAGGAGHRGDAGGDDAAGAEPGEGQGATHQRHQQSQANRPGGAHLVHRQRRRAAAELRGHEEGAGHGQDHDTIRTQASVLCMLARARARPIRRPLSPIRPPIRTAAPWSLPTAACR